MSIIHYQLSLIHYLVLIAVCLFILPAISGAKTDKTESKSPIQIEADHMMSDKKQNSVFFSGKVAAKQGDVLIHADEMTVYYNNKADDVVKDGADSGKSINRLRAVGSVEITKDEWVATGDNAEYIETERKVILTGNTKVWQNNSMVTGDKFILYLDEGKSIVESNAKKKERVKAFFYPDAETSGK